MRLAVYPLSFAGLAAMFCLLFAGSPRFRTGTNDFLGMYAGARLCCSTDLYDAARVRQAQLDSAGVSGPSLRVSRLPFFSWLLSPLARLSYPAAYRVWLALTVLALAGFWALWTETGRTATWVACCASLPLCASLANAQDVPFLLLWLALSAHLYRRGLHFTAGLVLSLCAAKYHLFLLLPLLLVGQSLWRYLWGAVAGCALIAGASFALAGWAWPAAYLRSITDSVMHPRLDGMPNLHGFTGEPVLLIAFSLAVAAACWVVVRAGDFRLGLAAVLTGGVLVSYHSYVMDCAVLIPALLIVAERQHGWLRYLALGLLAPLPWLLLLQGGHTADIPRAALLVLVGGLAVQAAGAVRALSFRWSLDL